MSDRPVTKKSSPSPIARGVESGAEVRRLSPVKRIGIPLGVAAAIALAGGSGIAYAVASSGPEKHASRDDRSERSSRVDRDERKPPKTPVEKGKGGSFVDDVFQQVGDFLNPDPDEVVEVKPTTPEPVPTVTPTYIPPNPHPPVMAGMISPPRPTPTVAVPLPKPKPVTPIANPPAMPGGMRPPAPTPPSPTGI